MKKIIATIVISTPLIFSTTANSQNNSTIKIPSSIYKKSQPDIDNENVQIYTLEPKKLIGEDPDIVYHCKGNLWFCGHQDNISPLFWYDDDGHPRQFDFTYTPKPKKIGKWHGYYTFVVCQWGGLNVHVNYGGECYAQVMSDGKNTIGFLLSLGKFTKEWSYDSKKIKYFNKFYFGSSSAK